MKILFIGNSFTARNDVPGLIAAMSAARGGHLDHALISAGGASLRMHWNRGDALARIRATRHDWVVLQEQSTLPVKNARRMHENVRLFAEEIGASGARTALYLTWARRNAPESQQAITDAYQAVAKELGCAVAPVGIAWQEFIGSHDRPVLHDRDLSHPTPAGSYLAACVLFGVLTGGDPVGLPSLVPGLGDGDALALQAAARDAVRAATDHG